jgi:hypothetical protein
VRWKPDISFMTQDQLLYSLGAHEQGTQLDVILDLIAFKTPRLRVLEIHPEGEDSSSLWLEPNSEESLAARMAYEQYDYASPDAQALASAETTCKTGHKAAFHLFAPDREDLGLPAASFELSYDLVLIMSPKRAALDDLVAQTKRLVKSGGCIVLVPASGDMSTMSKLQSVEELMDEYGSGSGSASTGSQSPSKSLSSSPVIIGDKWQSTGYTTPTAGTQESKGDQNDVDQDEVLILPGVLALVAH